MTRLFICRPYRHRDTKPEQFRKEPSVKIVVNSINATLFNHGKERAIKDLALWDWVDQVIDLEESDVYSYNPESDSDPNDEEGGGTLYDRKSVCFVTLFFLPFSNIVYTRTNQLFHFVDRWSFNYFFFNRKLKRIIYFTMRGVSYGAPAEEDDDDETNNFNTDDDDEEGGVGHRRRK